MFDWKCKVCREQWITEALTSREEDIFKGMNTIYSHTDDYRPCC